MNFKLSESLQEGLPSRKFVPLIYQIASRIHAAPTEVAKVISCIIIIIIIIILIIIIFMFIFIYLYDYSNQGNRQERRTKGEARPGRWRAK